MKIVNQSEGIVQKFVNSDNEGRRFGIVCLSKRFELVGSKGLFNLVERGSDFCFADEFSADPTSSSITRLADLENPKPTTDIICYGFARTPDRVLSKEWAVEFSLKLPSGLELWKAGFTARGRQYWNITTEDSDNPNSRSWDLSKVEPMNKIPLSFSHSFGGITTLKAKEGERHKEIVFEQNPLGKGLLCNDMSLSGSEILAPQLVAAGQELSKSDPFQKLEVAGCGAVCRHWLPRRLLGGTYDKNWLETTWPNWASDYDFRYNNAALPSFQLNCRSEDKQSYLLAGETLKLKGLSFSEELVKIKLPKEIPYVLLTSKDITQPELLRLDTLQLDVNNDDTSSWTVRMTWRAVFDHNAVDQISVHDASSNRVLTSLKGWIARGGEREKRLVPPTIEQKLGCWPSQHLSQSMDNYI